MEKAKNDLLRWGVAGMDKNSDEELEKGLESVADGLKSVSDTKSTAQLFRRPSQLKTKRPPGTLIVSFPILLFQILLFVNKDCRLGVPF